MTNETNPGTLDEATVTEFWSKVDKRSDDECWPWNGPRNNPRSGAPSGYGRIYIRRKINQAHRLSYELVHGPIPEGLVIDHLCRNPCCVNPAHLEAVSNQENVLRGTGHTARNAVKTHCVNGHPLVGDNLIARKRKFRNYAGVERNCRQCQTERKRVYRREDVANLESYKKMREIAIDALGYESILEALEAAPPAAQSQPAATVQEVGRGEMIERFRDAVANVPYIIERVAGGQQFNAYESAGDDDEEVEDEDREYRLCIGPISNCRFIADVEGHGRAQVLEAALKLAYHVAFASPSKAVEPAPEQWEERQTRVWPTTPSIDLVRPRAPEQGALQDALEAVCNLKWCKEDRLDEAIKILRRALAHPSTAPQQEEVEPIGEIIRANPRNPRAGVLRWTSGQQPPVGTKLYAHPSPAPQQPQSEAQADKGDAVRPVQARRIVDAVTEFCRGADFSCDMKAATKAIMPLLDALAPSHPTETREDEADAWEAIEDRAWEWLQETFGAVKPAVELDYAPHQMVAAFHAGHAAALTPKGEAE